MSLSQEEINRIKNMSFKEFAENKSKNVSKKPKEGIMKTMLLWPFRLIKAIMGIDTSSNSSGSIHASGQDYSVPIPPSPSNTGFRDEYRFNPEQAHLRRMQEMGYHQLVDGKGDPEQHECHCDHDDK